MKKIYVPFLLAFLFNLNTQAQLTLTKATNEPVVGDVNITKNFDTVTVFPKTSGTGQSWNFSNLTANTSTETFTYTTVAASPSPAAFSNASLAQTRGGNEWDFMKSNASTFEYACMIFGPNDAAVFSDNGILYNWPISYNSTHTDQFAATETNGTNTATWNGTITSIANGSGTITMPGGGIYTNCLMIKRTINITIASASSTTQVTLKDYEFWSSGFKFPLVTGQYESSITGTVVTNKPPSFWLNTAALPVGLKENAISTFDFNVYPNPANTEVNIGLNKDLKDYQIEVIDLAGKVLIRAENTSKLNVSALERGFYFITVKNDHLSARRSLIITK